MHGRTRVIVQAIGAAGAAALLSAVAARGKANARPGGKVTVLTHCNTGSLATAGYGTALGVVRALHEQGRLERCYACETRPYNQGKAGAQGCAAAAAAAAALARLGKVLQQRPGVSPGKRLVACSAVTITHSSGV